MRPDGRLPDQMRKLEIALSPQQYPAGSALIRMGGTEVLCSVMVEERVPRWLCGQEQGWLTAEYALLPGATHSRTARSHVQGGRAQEIRRLIGRSLRQAVNLETLGERTLYVDCDVLQADGGTRTAAVSGGYVAVALAIQRLHQTQGVPLAALRMPIAALSVGLVSGEARLDLAYEEDAQADVDLNVAMDAQGRFIEVQGTAERTPMTRAQLHELLDLAARGIADVIAVQRESLACVGIEI